MQALANLLSIAYWPLWVGCGYMFVVAVLYQLLGRVPNAVTLSAIGAAWLVGLLEGVPGLLPVTGGGIVSSLVCSGACLLILLKAYKVGLGAGCLKAQMGLGAWIGCALPLETAFIVSALATFIGAATIIVLAIVLGRLHGKPVSHLPLSDGRPREAHHFPAQIPLSFGSIGGVLLAFVLTAHGPRPIAAPAQPQAAAQPAPPARIN